MKKEITSNIQIKAKPQVVWSILTDFEKFPDWNPFIFYLKGKPIVGQQIAAKIQNMNFKPTVLVFDKNREFKWKGKLFIKGLFDGEHRFLLTENKDGSTSFTQSETFSGILVKLMSKTLDTKTLGGFMAMNQKLKELSEKQ